jgi:hypothetical protein
MGIEILGYGVTLSTISYSLLAYVVVVRLLRYRTREALWLKYPYKTRGSFKNMTNKEAFEIQRKIASQEFPFTYEKSLQFALFRFVILFCPSVRKDC